jgi:hypothetical protein
MTKREIEVFTDPAAFRLAVAGKKPKQARSPAPRAESTASSIARAPAGEGDKHAALERLAQHGISMRYDTGIGFYAWHAATGQRRGQSSDSYAAAIALAEKEINQ